MTLKHILLLVILVLIVGGCANDSPTDDSKVKASPVADNSAATLKGVSLSPKSFQAGDFTEFWEKAAQSGKVVSWAGDWNELSSSQSGPKVVSALAAKYELIPIVEAQFFTQSNGKLLRPLDDATKLAYKESAVAFVKEYKPEYLGLGIEVNVLHQKSPSEFNEFVLFYSEVYDAIKVSSPNTKVFTIFQLEKMKGLNGGLFGGENDPAKAEWELLDKFPKSDIVAFTTYPGLIYTEPSEIPADYYSEIKLHTSKPIVFTEIGWHSAGSPAGWESSEEEQVEFVEVFLDRTKELKLEMIIWSFMYDQDTIGPFDSMGLHGMSGKAKLAWNEWVKIK